MEEINCGSVNLTTVQPSLLMCAGGAAASLVSALVKAQLIVSVLTQEYIKLLTNQPKLRGGDLPTSCPCKPVDAEDDDGDEDDEDDDDNNEEEGNPTGDGKTSAKNGPDREAGGVEENGEDEDDDEQDFGQIPNDDEDDEDDEEDDEDDEEDDVEEEGVEEEEDEEEDEDEDEEAIQPPKKRRK